MLKPIPFSELIGKTITEILIKSDYIIFETSDCKKYLMYHYQDCCENVWIDNISGELTDLIGLPVLSCEESCGTTPDDCTESGTYTWTFYRITTFSCTVVIQWRGESNGYYSESVEFLDITNYDYKEIIFKNACVSKDRGYTY